MKAELKQSNSLNPEDRYVLVRELLTNVLVLCKGSGDPLTDCDCNTIQEALKQLPNTGQIALELWNQYCFGRLGTDLEDEDLLAFSEQSALKAMRNTGFEGELSEQVDRLEEDHVSLSIDGETKNGVKMALCTIWSGLYLLHILLLFGEAGKVKKFVKAVAI